jgi:ComF family protein
MKTWMQKILNGVFPVQCRDCHAWCESGGFPLCHACRILWFPRQLNCEWLESPHAQTSLPLIYCWHYKGLLRGLYKDIKYQGLKSWHNVLKEFTLAMVGPNLMQGIDLLIPVPSLELKKRERGFIVADSIGECLSSALGVKCGLDVLQRQSAKTQTRLNRTQRSQLATLNYSIRGDLQLQGLNVMLIDDVVTTGATLHACANVLKANGAEMVKAFCLFRA